MRYSRQSVSLSHSLRWAGRRVSLCLRSCMVWVSRPCRRRRRRPHIHCRTAAASPSAWIDTACSPPTRGISSLPTDGRLDAHVHTHAHAWITPLTLSLSHTYEFIHSVSCQPVRQSSSVSISREKLRIETRPAGRQAGRHVRGDKHLPPERSHAARVSSEKPAGREGLGEEAPHHKKDVRRKGSTQVVGRHADRHT